MTFNTRAYPDIKRGSLSKASRGCGDIDGEGDIEGDVEAFAAVASDSVYAKYKGRLSLE